MAELQWQYERDGIFSAHLGRLRLVVGPTKIRTGCTFTVLTPLALGKDVWAEVGSGHCETVAEAQAAATTMAIRFESAH